jgi:hypothetical protein
MVERPAVNRRVAGSSPAWGASFVVGVCFWVTVAQLAESGIVIPVVVGSSPISHPKAHTAKVQ